ncbi:MAG: hypothetical protein Q7S71_05790, partial [Candidatus Nitrotoga sp.]|nr:hypothetical protein [Candidatus Nitrotoga sp.]
EGDTVIGKNHKGGLVTLAERKSRYVLAGHIRSKHAEGVTAVTTSLLIQRVVERLNHRPRKVLGFRSPHEVLFGVEMCYTKPALEVALRT